MYTDNTSGSEDPSDEIAILAEQQDALLASKQGTSTPTARAADAPMPAATERGPSYRPSIKSHLAPQTRSVIDGITSSANREKRAGGEDTLNIRNSKIAKEEEPVEKKARTCVSDQRNIPTPPRQDSSISPAKTAEGSISDSSSLSLLLASRIQNESEHRGFSDAKDLTLREEDEAAGRHARPRLEVCRQNAPTPQQGCSPLTETAGETLHAFCSSDTPLLPQTRNANEHNRRSAASLESRNEECTPGRYTEPYSRITTHTLHRGESTEGVRDPPSPKILPLSTAPAESGPSSFQRSYIPGPAGKLPILVCFERLSRRNMANYII